MTYSKFKNYFYWLIFVKTIYFINKNLNITIRYNKLSDEKIKIFEETPEEETPEEETPEEETPEKIYGSKNLEVNEGISNDFGYFLYIE